MVERGTIESVGVVALYPREDGPAGWRDTRLAAEWLTEREVTVAVPNRLLQEGPVLPSAVVGLDSPNMPDGRTIDLTVALGGDGTLLHAARWVADREIPVVGINLGDLGFLSTYRSDELTIALQDLVSGRLQWESRERMHISVMREGEEIASDTACNDAYVKHGVIPRLLRLACHIGDQYMATYKADGLIVCTPMGSTAYNLAAGGPIVAPGTGVLTVTPICPHSLTHRPVVTPESVPIRIAYVGPRDVSSAFLTSDGEWTVELRVGDEVHVTGAPKALKLVPPRTSVFQVLATKLGWSGPGAGDGPPAS